MKPKKKIRILVIGLLLTMLSVLTYELLWGKLFSFSPVILGFSPYELPHSRIYVQNGGDVSGLTAIDSLVPAVEDFHELKFIHKPKIFIFRDSISFIRHSLSKARFCVYPNSRFFISPWAIKEDKEGKISLEIYARHELSHALIDQNAGLINAFRYPQWLMEGIAVFSTNQMGTSFYPGKEETYHAIATGNFIPPFDFKTKREDSHQLNVKYRITFMYSEFACIVDYLVAKYGKATFLNYMKALLKDSDHNKIFKQIYGTSFEAFLKDFKQFVVKSDNLTSEKQKQADAITANN